MKKILLSVALSIASFAAPRYDYTIQNVFEYYNTNSNIVVSNDGWHFKDKAGYFNNKHVFFEAYVNSIGTCTNTDNCTLSVGIELPYSNFSKASLNVTTSYKNILALKDGTISRTTQMICIGDTKGDFVDCEFLKENKTN